ncbi:flagellar basal body P-ring formation chaperone FlgA [Sulfurimonas sp.]|nr:flagellar basal body P-ring formation chaperone FlgA [Sulfurimonas sp.]
MLIKLILLTYLSLTSLFSGIIETNYYTKNHDINLSLLIPSISKDIKLAQIDLSKYSKKMKSKELVNLLFHHGFKGFIPKGKYVTFTKKSPVKMLVIKEWLKKLYKKKYKGIDIHSIFVNPRGYLEELPKEYTVGIQSKSHLKNSGVVYIKSKSHRQIFFNYTIKAKVTVYTARKKIIMNEELFNGNCVKNSIMLDTFKALPVKDIQKAQLQSKHNIRKDAVITLRDVTGLDLVKRGSKVTVSLNHSNMDISFIAEANQNGRYGESIYITSTNGKKNKAVVTGRNKVEIK